MTLKTRLRYATGSAILFMVFLLIAAGVYQRNFKNLDFDTTVWIQSAIPTQLDYFFSLFSILGAFEISLLYLGLLFIAIFLKEKKIFVGIVLFFLIAAIEFIGKVTLYHPGPPYEFLRNTFILRFPSSFIHTNYAFPSGHMGRAAFFAILLIILIRRWLNKREHKYVAYTAIGILYLIFFISRISLGEHWYSDVIGGSFLGLSLGLLSFAFW